MKEKISEKIIGQEKVVSSISRIFEIFKNSQCEIKPHFILTGASGCSKSYTIQTLAEIFDFGFLEINAAQLTKEGTSGNSLSKALTPLQNFQNIPTIVFVDEFDKLIISTNSNDSLAHETTTGVQNEFLKVLESNQANVFGDYGKYFNVNIQKVLFIFAGAFNGEEDLNLTRLQEIGLKTEFLGRVNLVFNTEKLTLEDLYIILDRSQMLKQYLNLFDTPREKVVQDIREEIKKLYELNTIGARIVNAKINEYFINGGFKQEPEKKKSYTKMVLA